MVHAESISKAQWGKLREPSASSNNADSSQHVFGIKRDGGP